MYYMYVHEGELYILSPIKKHTVQLKGGGGGGEREQASVPDPFQEK